MAAQSKLIGCVPVDGKGRIWWSFAAEPDVQCPPGCTLMKLYQEGPPQDDTAEQLAAVTAERDALRAELAALKGREPVAWEVYFGRRWRSCSRTEAADFCADSAAPVRGLYAAPVPAPAPTAQPVQIPGAKGAAS